MNDSSKNKKAATGLNYKQLKLSSTSFNNGEIIPSKYTCDGININPQITIEHIPEGVNYVALIVDDPDAPMGTWVHWVVWNIPVRDYINENEVPGIEGINDFKQHHYGGPCPPSGTHRYFFKIYALDTLLNLPPETTKNQLEKAISEHIIAFGELIGLYKRNK